MHTNHDQEYFELESDPRSDAQSVAAQNRLSRREFLKVAGAGALAGMGASFSHGPNSLLAWPAPKTPPGIALTQLHLHATTNHNANYLPQHLASLQWHSWMARNAPGMTPYDVVWWSEHRHFYDQTTNFVIKLETGTIDPTTWTLYNMSPFDIHSGVHRHMAAHSCCDEAGHRPLETNLLDRRYYAERMVPAVTGDPAALRCSLPGNDFWEIQLANPQTAGTTVVEYAPLSQPPDPRELGSYFLPRPVFSEVNLQFDYYRSGEADGQSVEIEVLLSDHVRLSDGQYVKHSVLFVLGTYNDVSGPIQTADKTQIRVTVGTPEGGDWTGGWHTLSLPITEYARLLLPGSDEGIDNTIQQLYVRASAPQGQGLTFGIRYPTLVSSVISDQTNWEQGKSLAASYQVFGHQSYFGYEASYSPTSSGTHLNVFLPTSAGNILPPLDLDTGQLAAWAANLGGICSYNHPFGASNGGIDPQQDQRTRTVASNLLANNVLGCKLLEVGYTERGHVDFAHHVKLWDYLLANNRLVYGVGANDAHGQVWDWHIEVGCYGAWVYYDGDLTQDSLLAGLQSGKIYFGNPWQMDGALDLTVNGVSMGGSTVVAGGSRFTVRFDLPAWPSHSNWIVTLKLFAINYPNPQTAAPLFRSRSYSRPVRGATLVMPRGFDVYLRLEVQLNDSPSYWSRTTVAWSNPIWIRRN